MKRRIITIISALALIVALGIPHFAAAAGNGTILGSITNKTAGTTSSVNNVQITLTTSVNGAPTGDATTTTDANGAFSFTGLTTDATYNYQITFVYESANYTSDPLTFTSGQDSQTVTIPVYDTTSDTSLISLGVVHTIMSAAPGTLTIIQFYAFQNSSTDRAFINAAGKTPLLSFSIPTNATNLQFAGLSSGVTETTDGMSDPSSILPGEQDITLQYDVPQAGTYHLSQVLSVPTQQYNLLMEGTSVQLANSNLTKVDPLQFNGKTYSHFTGTNLPAGVTITGDLTFPAGGTGSTGSNMVILFAIVGVVVLGGGLAFVLMQRRKSAPVPAAATAQTSPDEVLLAEIAALDDEFESGNISKESYEEQRAEKKAQLVELLQGTRGTSSEE